MSQRKIWYNVHNNIIKNGYKRRLKKDGESMKAKFCRECGAEIPENASYCPGCGMDVLTEEEENFNVKVANNDERTFDNHWHNSGKFQKLIVLLWVGFIVDLVSTVVGCFDVREYYSVGRFGALTVGLLFIGWCLWHIVAMMHRKSWSRKSFIVLQILITVAYFIDVSSNFDRNMIVACLTILSLVLGFYCLFLCFGKEVVKAFLPDSKVKGSRAAVNRYHCASFWIYFFALVIITGGYMIVHEGSDQWIKDCKEAAIEGSSSARKDLIDKLTEEYSAGSSDGEQIEKAQDKATREIDQLIKDNKKPSQSNAIGMWSGRGDCPHWRYIGKTVEYNPYGN